MFVSSGKTTKVGKKLGGSKKKEMLTAAETKPSPQGRRVIPKIDVKLKEKFEKETLSKENKGKRVSNVCKCENLIFSIFRFFSIEFCTNLLYPYVCWNYMLRNCVFLCFIRLYITWKLQFDPFTVIGLMRLSVCCKRRIEFHLGLTGKIVYCSLHLATVIQ